MASRFLSLRQPSRELHILSSAQLYKEAHMCVTQIIMKRNQFQFIPPCVMNTSSSYTFVTTQDSA